jgi:nitroimidazol reductase NimA-like FMN-containing flavoprotein (pyridoxamine 5'-phosphate oxidase superfamily)
MEPKTTLDQRFSSPDAKPTSWDTGRAILEAAPILWITTVRPDGRPHVAPIIGGWIDGAFYFSTGPDEQKARNLETNPHCVVTTGNNRLDEGLDIVIEGDAMRLTDEARMHDLARVYDSKYAPLFHFEVHDGDFGGAIVFRVQPVRAFGFGRRTPQGEEATLMGGIFSQTRWRF